MSINYFPNKYQGSKNYNLKIINPIKLITVQTTSRENIYEINFMLKKSNL